MSEDTAGTYPFYCIEVDEQIALDATYELVDESEFDGEMNTYRVHAGERCPHCRAKHHATLMAPAANVPHNER